MQMLQRTRFELSLLLLTKSYFGGWTCRVSVLSAAYSADELLVKVVHVGRFRYSRKSRPVDIVS